MGGGCSTSNTTKVEIINLSGDETTQKKKVKSTESEESLDTMEKIKERKKKFHEKVSIFVNGKKYRVEKNKCIVDGLNDQLTDYEKIPTFCYHPFLPPSKLYKGKCGICNIKNLKTGETVRGCQEKPTEGMELITNSEEIQTHIISILKEKLSYHPLHCNSCEVNGNCQFQDLLEKYDVDVDSLSDEQKKRYMNMISKPKKEMIANHAIYFDPTLCLQCYSCIRSCENIAGMSVLKMLTTEDKFIKTKNYEERGKAKFRDLEDYHENMYQSDCLSCGQCSFVCPTGAIQEISHYKTVSKLLERQILDEYKRPAFSNSSVVCVQLAPAARVALSESFFLKSGTLTEKQIVTILKMVGFTYVFDVTIGADLTIAEEAHEFMYRLKNQGPWPMITSCCPATVNLIEKHFPEYKDNLSTVKSPHILMGKMIKDYWGKKHGLKRSQIKVISIMPCTAKKDEVSRFKIQSKGNNDLIDVDYAITTRELSKMIKRKKILNIQSLDETPFDEIESSTKNGLNFGGSGGVATAAVQNIFAIGKQPVPKGFFKKLHNSHKEGELSQHNKRCKKANVIFKGTKIKIEIIQTGRMIKKKLKEYSKNTNQQSPAFLECMCCPGGCLGGSGQPKLHDPIIMENRKSALRKIGKGRTRKVSITHPFIKELFAKYIGKPMGSNAHKLIHTTFEDRRNETFQKFKDSSFDSYDNLFYSRDDYDESSSDTEDF